MQFHPVGFSRWECFFFFVGLDGGVSRRGQVRSGLVVLSGAYMSLSEEGVSVASHAVSGSVMLPMWRVFPSVGKVLVIISSAVQVSRLRKSLPESLFTYTTCRLSRVLPDGDLPENLRMTAPRILIQLLFAACICMVTGIRSLSRRPRRQMTFMIAKQLWQPVSAIADGRTGVSRDMKGCIPVLCSLRGGQSL